jgi:hypothetical protein
MFEGFLFRQRNDEQPAGVKQAGCELFNARLWRFFLSKKQRAACWRETNYLRRSTQRSIAPSIFKIQVPIGLEPCNNG